MSPLQPIPARDPSEETRITDLLKHLEYRAVVCLCSLILEFHVSKHAALHVMTGLVDQGRFRVAPGSPPGEPIYLSTRPDIPSDQLLAELIQVTRDIEFSVGVLEEVFPGCRRAVPFREQGQQGAIARKSLRATVLALIDLRLVPEYWRYLKLNSTAIVLSLRDILGVRSEMTSFLRSAPEIGAGLELSGEAFLRRLATASDSLQRASKGLAEQTSTLRQTLARIPSG